MTKEEERVKELKQTLANMGPMLPGSISKQWNVCGTKGCRCKTAKNPIKHGPYYQLSFTVGGKSSTLFLKKEDLPEARRRIKRFSEFKALTKDLARAYVDLARKHGLDGSKR